MRIAHDKHTTIGIYRSTQKVIGICSRVIDTQHVCFTVLICNVRKRRMAVRKMLGLTVPPSLLARRRDDRMRRVDVGYWHKADIGDVCSDVRYWG